MRALEFVGVWAAVMVIHVSAMAAGIRWAGIPIREIHYGMGMLVGKFGVFRIHLLPIGGSVKMLLASDEGLTEEQRSRAIDRQPLLVQAGVVLVGSLTLLAVALLILGAEGWWAFARGFRQIVMGALSPLDTAQGLIASYANYLDRHTFLESLALLCAKMAAFNLLPIPPLNGGDALFSLMGHRRWSDTVRGRVLPATVVLVFALSCAWLIAGVAFVHRAWAGGAESPGVRLSEVARAGGGGPRPGGICHGPERA